MVSELHDVRIVCLLKADGLQKHFTHQALASGHVHLQQTILRAQ